MKCQGKTAFCLLRMKTCSSPALLIGESSSASSIWCVMSGLRAAGQVLSTCAGAGRGAAHGCAARILRAGEGLQCGWAGAAMGLCWGWGWGWAVGCAGLGVSWAGLGKAGDSAVWADVRAVLGCVSPPHVLGWAPALKRRHVGRVNGVDRLFSAGLLVLGWGCHGCAPALRDIAAELADDMLVVIAVEELEKQWKFSESPVNGSGRATRRQ